MRASGVIEEAQGLGHGDHLCWAFDDEAAFHEVVAGYFREGLDRGEKLLYLGAAAGPVEELRASGHLEVQDLGAAYRAGRSLDPEARAAGFRVAALAAVVEGYHGLRVAADTTDLVLDDASRETFLRYELVVDGTIATSPLTGMCGFDRRSIPGDSLADLGSVHPLRGGLHNDDPAFVAFTDGDGIALRGEVDICSWHRLNRVLASAASGRGPVVLDLRELRFVDAHGLAKLATLAAELRHRSRTLVLRHPSPAVLRSWSALGHDLLSNVVIER